MTRVELHNLPGFNPSHLVAAAGHLRETMKRRKAGSDATALINNEGWMNGYLDAVEALLEAASPKQEKPPTAPHLPYSQPATQNENKPK